MKTDIQTSNETTTPNSHELNILKKYFPQCFSKPDTDENGNIIKEHFDIEKLTELLNKDEVDIKKEGFTLNFLGKSYAHYQSNLDSETVIVPDEKNAESDSENVYIVGDNLDALQHLKYSYAEKIKCIYIDPPYNTGKDDFVYNDKFGFTAKELVEKLDVSEEEAERICGMNGKCTHSAWLTFMYPRLALARELLREDGVIFISIDDNEQANLKRLCDEVFGEGNFLGEFIWRKKDGGGQAKEAFVIEHEYILAYSKSLERDWIEIIEKRNKAEFNKTDEKGIFKVTKLAKWGNTAHREERPTMYFPLTTPVGTEAYPIAPDGAEGRWRVGKSTMQELIDSNLIYWTQKDNVWIPYEKEYYSDQNKILKERSILYDVANTGDGSDLLTDLFGVKDTFENPKPIEIIKVFLVHTMKQGDLFLDFFSGSGSSAHAFFDFIIEKKIKCHFIQVQLNEECKKGKPAYTLGYKTIDELGRDRIRKAAAKIKAEHPDTSADLGFKTYYLKSMPKETLDKIKTFDPNALISSDGDIVKSLGEKTLLQTWQIKDGFGFNAVPQKIDLSGFTAYLLDDEKIGKYLYLLGEIEEKSIKELIRKIESLELTVDKIFIYGYSFDFNMLNCITTNLKTLKNRNPLEPIVRY